MKPGLLLVGTLFLTYPGIAQKLRKADKEVAARLAEEAGNLQKDTGMAACTYMSARFAEVGLTKKIQVNAVDAGRIIGPSCALSLDGKKAVVGTEFFPLVGSPDGHTSGSSGVSLNEGGLPWIHDLKDDLEAGTDIRKSLVEKVQAAKKKGATALILYNSTTQPDDLSFDTHAKATYALPVVYVTRGLSAKAFKDPTAYVDVDLTVSTAEKWYNLYEAEGLIDNNAPRTVLVEASLDSSKGAAALIELARMVRHAGWKKSNFLFVGYTGDYLSRVPVLTEDSVQVVINLDTEFRNSNGYEGEALDLKSVYKNLEASERK